MSKYNHTVQEALNIGLGQAGSVYLDADGTQANGTFNAITMVDDTTFDVLTDATRSGDDPLGDTFPKGLTIFGSFTAISVDSGKCIAYKA